MVERFHFTRNVYTPPLYLSPKPKETLRVYFGTACGGPIFAPRDLLAVAAKTSEANAEPVSRIGFTEAAKAPLTRTVLGGLEGRRHHGIRKSEYADPGLEVGPGSWSAGRRKRT